MSTVLSACSVPPDGWVGVGRDGQGQLTVYLRTCHYPLDGATLSWPDDPSGANSNEEVFARWSIRPEARELRAQWPLLGSDADVDADPVLSAVPDRPYNMSIFAWTDSNTYSADGPFRFTALDDLAALRRGQVLIANYGATADTDPPNVVVSLAQFNRLDCAQFSS